MIFKKKLDCYNRHRTINSISSLNVRHMQLQILALIKESHNKTDIREIHTKANVCISTALTITLFYFFSQYTKIFSNDSLMTPTRYFKINNCKLSQQKWVVEGRKKDQTMLSTLVGNCPVLVSSQYPQIPVLGRYSWTVVAQVVKALGG